MEKNNILPRVLRSSVRNAYLDAGAM